MYKLLGDGSEKGRGAILKIVKKASEKLALRTSHKKDNKGQMEYLHGAELVKDWQQKPKARNGCNAHAQDNTA